MPLSFVWPPRLTQQRRATDQTTPTTEGTHTQDVVCVALSPSGCNPCPWPRATEPKVSSRLEAGGRAGSSFSPKPKGASSLSFLSARPACPTPHVSHPAPLSLHPCTETGRSSRPPARPRAQEPKTAASIMLLRPIPSSPSPRLLLLPLLGTSRPTTPHSQRCLDSFFSPPKPLQSWSWPLCARRPWPSWCLAADLPLPSPRPPSAGPGEDPPPDPRPST